MNAAGELLATPYSLLPLVRCSPMVRRLPVKETIAGSNPATAAPPRAVCACGSMSSEHTRTKRESTGRMRGLSRKQVVSHTHLWVRVPRLPPLKGVVSRD